MITKNSLYLPILCIDKPFYTEKYHNILVDLNDSRNLEPLVDMHHYGIKGECYYAREDGENKPYHRAICRTIKNGLWCRRTIALKLQEVNAQLKKFGYELFVWDAYRTMSCQKKIWEYHIDLERKKNSALSNEEVRQIVLQYVSDPSKFDRNDPACWPTHCTGASVDLTLRNLKTGHLLNMGTHFDDMGIKSHSDYFEKLLNKKQISINDERLLNRRILHNSMIHEGFINYPFEFWHFDWGNQMYMMNLRYYNKNSTKAWYGFIEPPKI